jgi:hypothetical protein
MIWVGVVLVGCVVVVVEAVVEEEEEEEEGKYHQGEGAARRRWTSADARPPLQEHKRLPNVVQI